MKLIELKIKGISYSETQSGAYALILSEVSGNRKLPIIIGGFEAQAIAIGIEEEVKPSRPLTHDLFKDFANIFEVSIKKVIIHKLIDGVFFSNIICVKNNVEKILDSRTSDAIAMAIRFEAPIFIDESIIKSAGFTSNRKAESKKIKSDKNWMDKTSEIEKENKLPSNLKNLSKSELKNLLKKLVANEEYENAAKIRDLISQKNV